MQLEANEQACVTRQKQYCPTLGPQCTAAKTCCESLPTEQQRESCLSQVVSYASEGSDASCPKLAQQQCPSYGPKCAALKACCATLSDSQQTSCFQQAQSFAVQNNETQCQQTTSSYCGK